MPRGVLARRRYSASAIALALALWAVAEVRQGDVRLRIAPFLPLADDEEGVPDQWRTLARWSRAASAGSLFGVPTALAASATLRSTAARVVSWLAGHAPPWCRDQGLPAQAFAGAAQLL